jgi:hypothetical protein
VLALGVEAALSVLVVGGPGFLGLPPVGMSLFVSGRVAPALEAFGSRVARLATTPVIRSGPADADAACLGCGTAAPFCVHAAVHVLLRGAFDHLRAAPWMTWPAAA